MKQPRRTLKLLSFGLRAQQNFPHICRYESFPAQSLSLLLRAYRNHLHLLRIKSISPAQALLGETVGEQMNSGLPCLGSLIIQLCLSVGLIILSAVESSAPPLTV